MRELAGAAVIGLFGACLGACSDYSASESVVPDAGDAGDARDASAPADGGPPVSLEQGCEAIAAANCNRVAACRPAVVQLLFGGPTTCIAQAKLQCINDRTAPGADAVAGLDACTAALAGLSCEEIYNQVWPRACAGKGVRADGAACIGDAQCAGGLCATIDARGCGVCRTANGVGGPCDPACEKGLVCANDACTRPGSEAMPCSATAPCSVRHYCGPGETCTPRGSEGSPCSASAPCDASLGVDCATDTMRCTKRPVVQPGAACVVSNGISTLCSGGQCLPAVGSGRSVCTAFPREGEPCGGDRACLLPFVCVAGQCVLPNQTFCPD